MKTLIYNRLVYYCATSCKQLQVLFILKKTLENRDALYTPKNKNNTVAATDETNLLFLTQIRKQNSYIIAYINNNNARKENNLFFFLNEIVPYFVVGS